MSVQPSTFDFVLRQPVLLIGAEPLARRRLEGILLQFGYEPESLCSAGSMAEARASFSRQPASVALVDPDLPDGNGMDLISEMYAANPDMTIVVVSAWRFEEDVLPRCAPAPRAMCSRSATTSRSAPPSAAR